MLENERQLIFDEMDRLRIDLFDRFENTFAGEGRSPVLFSPENGENYITLKVHEPWTTHDTIAVTEALIHKGYIFKEYIPFNSPSLETEIFKKLFGNGPVLVFTKELDGDKEC